MKPFFITGIPRAGTTITKALLDSHPNISVSFQRDRIMKPFFITGIPRAGTTITQALLDSHPDISVTNEHSYVHMFVDVYRQIVPRTDAEGFSYNEGDLELTIKLMTQIWPQVFYEFHKQRKPEAKLCGDKLPAYLFCMDFLREVFPGVKFILCTRNKEDACKSMRKMITVYRERDEKFVQDSYEKYTRQIRLNKDKDDCYLIDLDEVQSGKGNKIYSEATDFLGVPMDCNLDLIVNQ